MSKLKNNKPLLAILIIQFCLLLFAAGNFIYCKSNLYTTVIHPSELGCDASNLFDDKISIAASEPTTLAYTTSYHLSRGSYVVYINYSTNTDKNKLQAYSSNIPAHNFQSNAILLPDYNKSAALNFSIQSSGDISFNVDYCGNGYLDIYQISIHQTTDMAKRDLVYAGILCLFLGLAYYICTTSLTVRKTAFALISIILLASAPLFVSYISVGHDITFHLTRIDSIMVGIKNGVFPVKIHSVWAEGYGYATGVFYGDALLYIPALLRLMGVNIQSTYQIFTFMVNIATTLCAYYSFKKIFENNKYALLGCMLYTLSLYRLLNVYTRAAVGEYCAMIFLPLIFAGLYDIFCQKEKKSYLKLAILPTIGLTGIIHTHILSCEMVAFFIILTCIILIKKTIQPRILFPLLLTVLLTILINLGFIIPFADYYFTGEFLFQSDEWGAASIQNIGLFLYQIFSVFQLSGGGTWSTLAGISTEFTPGFGLPLSIIFFVCLYVLFTTQKKDCKCKYFPLYIFSFIFTVLSIYMSTYLFPWDFIASLSPMTETLVTSLQFPWRFLSLGTLFLSIAGCLALWQLETRIEKHQTYLIPGAIIILCFSTVLSSGWYYHHFLSTNTPYYLYDTQDLPSMNLYTCEYLPVDTNLSDIEPGRYETSPHISITSLTKEGTYILCHVENFGDEGFIEFPLLNYRGYTATWLESNQTLLLEDGFNNCVRVAIPAEFNGTICVEFQEPLLWRISELVSFISIIGIISYYVIYHFKKKKQSSETASQKVA